MGKNLGYGGTNATMLRNQLRSLKAEAESLHALVNEGDTLPEWVLSKVTVALDRITVARQYIQAKLEGMKKNPQKAVPARQAKRVAADAIKKSKSLRNEIRRAKNPQIIDGNLAVESLFFPKTRIAVFTKTGVKQRPQLMVDIKKEQAMGSIVILTTNSGIEEYDIFGAIYNGLTDPEISPKAGDLILELVDYLDALNEDYYPHLRANLEEEGLLDGFHFLDGDSPYWPIFPRQIAQILLDAEAYVESDLNPAMDAAYFHQEDEAFYEEVLANRIEYMEAVLKSAFVHPSHVYYLFEDWAIAEHLGVDDVLWIGDSPIPDFTDMPQDFQYHDSIKQKTMALVNAVFSKAMKTLHGKVLRA